MPFPPYSDTHDHVARALIVDQRGRILLLKRSALDYFPGQWELAGGATEHKDHALALGWEIPEETGLKLVEIGDMLGFEHFVVSEHSTFTEVIYAVKAEGSVVISDEHDDFMWLDTTDDLELSMSHTMKDLVERCKKDPELLAFRSIIGTNVQ